MEEVVDLHKTKGLMGMAIQGLIRHAGPVHPSPRTMSPAPISHLSMSSASILTLLHDALLSAFILRILSSHMTGICKANTGVPLPLRKD